MADPFPDYAAVTNYLYGLKAGGMKFGIDRMRRLAAAIGNPDRQYPIIHIAGTNGKGSVAAMIESIMRAAGRRTGLYTSPHLVKLGERVQVDRQILTEAEIVAYTNELRPHADRIAAVAPDEYPTFFEFMTAMAFLQFARRKVDVGIIEVGMGGRLDATNVVMPEVAVITSIGLDHCAELGYTLAEIAREKAGIIKPGRPVVMGRVPAEAEKVIREIAAERQAPLQSVRAVFGEELSGYPETNLSGDNQRWNAATATLAVQLLGGKNTVSAADVARGLQRVNWPGRWQRTKLGAREVILDASHNAEGAAILDQNLQRLAAETGRAPVVIAAAMGEMRAKALLAVLRRHARAIYWVTPNQARACSFDEIIAWVPAEQRAKIQPASVASLFQSPSRCAAGSEDEPLVVTGSIYLLGEVLAQIEPDRGSGEGRLQDF